MPDISLGPGCGMNNGQVPSLNNFNCSAVKEVTGSTYQNGYFQNVFLRVVFSEDMENSTKLFLMSVRALLISTSPNIVLDPGNKNNFH